MAGAGFGLAFGGGLALAALLASKRARCSAERPHAGSSLGLREGERAGAGLSRMAAEQLQVTISLLRRRRNSTIHETVHETRKAIKRLRALDRLFATSMDPAERRARRDALRQAAQQLADARDSGVALSTLDALIARDPQLAEIECVMRIRSQLSSERTAAELALQQHAQPQQALAALRRLQARPSVDAPTDEQIASALQQIYRRAQSAMKRALRTGSSEDLHTWRKRVKDLRHALEALTVNGTGPSHKEGKKVAKLGEVLGDEHDLEMLADRVDTARPRAEAKALEPAEQLGGEQQLLIGSAQLRAAIDRRKRSLRKDAFHMGRELLADSPRRFSQRLLSAKGGAAP